MGSEETENEANGRDPLVRPKGYVEERPVVRRIGDRDLFLGNERAAGRRYRDREFEFVLSVTAQERPGTTHHRPLIDGPGNEWAAFESAADAARRLYRRDGPLLVHCKAGVSRSAAVVATALAAEECQEFRAALTDVRDARPVAMPHPALHELGVVYLAARAPGSREPGERRRRRLADEDDAVQ